MLWEARRELDRVLRLNPEHARARVARAWVDYIVGTTVPRRVRWLLGGGNKKRGLLVVSEVVDTGPGSFFDQTEAKFALWDMQVREREILGAVATARLLARDFPENRDLRRFPHNARSDDSHDRPRPSRPLTLPPPRDLMTRVWPRIAWDNCAWFPMPKAKARNVDSREKPPTFDAEVFLTSAGAARRVVTYPKGKVVFSQGQPSDSVIYIQKGGIKMSVLSRTGKEAVVAMLGPGDFFGEGALTGQSIRIGTATATMPTTVLIIEKSVMRGLLRDEPTFSERFISYMLARNIRIEADLVDHLFNSSEKRLARTLLLLARFGEQEGPEQRIPKISQETLAEMVGTTRSRVNYFMNKFRDLGFIEYNGDLKVNTSLLSVVLHD